MANDKQFEDIEQKLPLSVFSYPVEKLENYSNFMLGRYNFWHNGIHLISDQAVNSIYDAQVVAYRFIKNYKHRNFDIDNAKFPPNSFINFLQNTKYNDIEKIFIKDDRGFYKLKEKASENEKEKAYKFLNKLYSNSFILLKHEIKNCDNKEISFYSLYNHLKPFARMTLEQKFKLCFYFLKAEMRINNTPYSAYCKFFDISQQKDVLLPAELPLSKDDNEKSYIKWEMNNNKYESLIDTKLIRTFKDGHVEIKRPGNDKTNNLTKKSDYVSSKSVIVLFDSGDRDKRLSKRYLCFQEYNIRDRVFEINSTDFVEWLENEKDTGLRIKYDNEYFFIYPTNRKKLYSAYKLLDKENIYKTATSMVYIFCSIEIGYAIKIYYFNGQNKFYLIDPKNKNALNIEYESYYVRLEKVYLIKNENRTLTSFPGNIIPCETKVMVTSNYTAKFDGNVYHGFIESQYVDNSQMKIKKARMYEGGDLKWKWKNDCILVYDSGDIGNRKVIDTIKNSGPLELSDKKDLLRFKTESEDKVNQIFPQFEKGISVNYKKHVPDIHIKSQFSGFIYLSFQNNSGIAYEIERNKKEFILNMTKWMNSVNEEGSDIVVNNFNGITISLHKDTEYIIDDTINYPDAKKVKKGDVIGFTGYSIADENDEIRKSNEDATSMHFEVFTTDNKFMNFSSPKSDEIEKKRLPCYCKVNSGCTAYQGKILTICGAFTAISNNLTKKLNTGFNSIFNKKQTSIIENGIKLGTNRLKNIIYNSNLDFTGIETFSKYENICYEEIEKGFLTEGQYYSCIKPIARIIPMADDEYFRRSDIEWDEGYRFYYINKTSEVQVYNNKNEPIEGKKIKLYKDFRYLETTHSSAYEESIKDDKTIEFLGHGEFNLPNDDKKWKQNDNKLRRFEFYFEKINVNIEQVYIKTSDLDEFEYRDGKNLHRYYYFYNDKKLDEEKLVQKPSGTCWNSQEPDYKEITLEKNSTKKYQFCYEFMHEYDKLQEGHTARETWCKIKSDSGTEYWVNKKDLDFTSKDGSKIGLVYYDKWEDFFCEINPSKYGEFKCNDEKAFIKDYKLKELGINSVQDIPSNSKAIKRFYYKAESEWSDNQKITDEYVNLSPSQEKETTEYRKDLAFFTDAFVSRLSKLKLSKKNYYYNPIAFLHHLDKVATPAEFNPYEGANIDYYASPQDRKNKKLSHYTVKDNPGFAPLYNDYESYEYEGMGRFGRVTGSFNEDYQYLDSYKNRFSEFYHEGLDLRGKTGTPVKALILCKVIAYGWYSTYGQVVFLSKKNDVGIYMIAHLSEYDSDIYVGKEYLPGETVGYVGASGKKDGKYDLNAWKNPHLHITYYHYEYSENKIVNSDNGEILFKGNIQSILINSRSNPFNHDSEKRKPNKELRSNMV